jgi:hypothetical protein
VACVLRLGEAVPHRRHDLPGPVAERQPQEGLPVARAAHLHRAHEQHHVQILTILEVTHEHG